MRAYIALKSSSSNACDPRILRTHNHQNSHAILLARVENFLTNDPNEFYLRLTCPAVCIAATLFLLKLKIVFLPIKPSSMNKL